MAEELARDSDPVIIRELISHVAQFADLIERCDGLISDNRSEWTEVGDVVRERRQLTAELRHLLAEIHRQRAGIPTSFDDDDVLDGA